MQYLICHSIQVESFYVDDGDYKTDKAAAFELAGGEFGCEKALESVRDELPDEIKVIEATFDEFDAANLTHAGAHYLVRIEGDAGDCERWLRAWFGMGWEDMVYRQVEES